MGNSLSEIAQTLKDCKKKVQLIYAFNGVGKTRLSRAFKELVTPKQDDSEEYIEDTGVKILYYNAFTEDLFYWDNDLDEDKDRKLIIRPNGFTEWVLKEEGQASNITTDFQHYTNDKLTPNFSADYHEVTFSIESGDTTRIENIKISRGEESCFVWCVFYSLMKEVVEVLNIPESEDRSTDKFNALEYIFIDDPVSSLDENHLIELAVNIADVIKDSSSDLKFIITTHNPLFYNVLYNEFNNKSAKYRVKDSIKRRLEKSDDGSYTLIEQPNDSPFSYHLYLLDEIEKAIESGNIQKYHFNFLRNILEKTSTFLGYEHWQDLLPKEARESYFKRIINFSSHGKFSGEEVPVLKDDDKRVLDFLIRETKRNFNFRNTIKKGVE